jgi:NADH-quinone oxidoreductase subunit G
MVNVTGRIQRLNRAIQPPGGTRDDWEILVGLVEAVRGAPSDPPLSAIEDIFRLLAAEVPEFKDLSLSKIGDTGIPVKETGATIPLLEKENARKAAGEITG